MPKPPAKKKNGNWRKGGNKPRQPMGHPWRKAIFPHAVKNGSFSLNEDNQT